MANSGIENQAAKQLAERKEFDQDAIDNYVVFLTDRWLHNATMAGVPSLPPRQDLLQKTAWALDIFYDNSTTIAELHAKVRTSSDPQSLQLFLDRLPETVLSDMSASAMIEEERQTQKRETIVTLLDHALKTHQQTTIATLRILGRFKDEILRDPEVKSLVKVLMDNGNFLQQERKKCVDAGVFKNQV